MFGQLVQPPKLTTLTGNKKMLQFSLSFVADGVNSDTINIPGNIAFGPLFIHLPLNGLQIDIDTRSYISVADFGEIKAIGFDVAFAKLESAGSQPLFVWNQATNEVIALVAKSTVNVAGTLPLHTSPNPKLTFFKVFDGAIPVVATYVGQCNVVLYNFDVAPYINS